MNTDSKPVLPASSPSRLPLEVVLFAISSPVRWRILSTLSLGEPLLVVELAERLGRDAGMVSKHLAVLRKAGLVAANRAGLYHIPQPYLPVAGQRVVDLGHCLLRLEDGS